MTGPSGSFAKCSASLEKRHQQELSSSQICSQAPVSLWKIGSQKIIEKTHELLLFELNIIC
jgi:hypothetical protein